MVSFGNSPVSLSLQFRNLCICDSENLKNQFALGSSRERKRKIISERFFILLLILYSKFLSKLTMMMNQKFVVSLNQTRFTLSFSEFQWPITQILLLLFLPFPSLTLPRSTSKPVPPNKSSAEFVSKLTVISLSSFFSFFFFQFSFSGQGKVHFDVVRTIYS